MLICVFVKKNCRCQDMSKIVKKPPKVRFTFCNYCCGGSFLGFRNVVFKDPSVNQCIFFGILKRFEVNLLVVSEGKRTLNARSSHLKCGH